MEKVKMSFCYVITKIEQNYDLIATDAEGKDDLDHPYINVKAYSKELETEAKFEGLPHELASIISIGSGIEVVFDEKLPEFVKDFLNRPKAAETSGG